MASITAYQTKAGKRWRVRYRKPDRSQTDKRGFRTKRDAEVFAATIEVSKNTGTYIDPSAGKITIGELGPAWMARQTDWKPSYRYTVTSTWHTHVQPRWGHIPIADVNRPDVETWIAGLNRSRSVAARCVTILNGILDDAVAAQLIYSNRLTGISLPKSDPKPRVYLSHEQVEAFAQAAGPHAMIVRTLAYTGLRWGELAGLHGPDVDVRRRRIAVNRNAVLVGSRIVVGTPKSHELRTVPLPRFLAEQLQVPDGIMFPAPDGGYRRPPRASSSRRSWWKSAIEVAGIPLLTPHDMRHTAASLAVQAGAHVKAVQRMLGHKSAAMTLDVYSDLFDSDLDVVADAMDAARARVV